MITAEVINTIHENPRPENFSGIRPPVDVSLRTLGKFNVIFFGKRPLEVPAVVPKPPDQPCINILKRYLNGRPIYVAGDSREFYKEYPELEEANQFRGNSMAKVILAMQVMTKIHGQTDRNSAPKLNEVSSKTLRHIQGTGIPYNKITDPLDKLEIVHHTEDSIIEFLRIYMDHFRMYEMCDI